MLQARLPERAGFGAVTPVVIFPFAPRERILELQTPFLNDKERRNRDHWFPVDDHDGWYALGAVGVQLLAEMPDFDPRSYGCPKLSQLVEKSGAFDVRRNNLMVYIRPK